MRKGCMSEKDLNPCDCDLWLCGFGLCWKRISAGQRHGLSVRGGLEHPLEWYITETVIHHQPKLTRQGPPGPAFRRRIARRRPGSMTSPNA